MHKCYAIAKIVILDNICNTLRLFFKFYLFKRVMFCFTGWYVWCVDLFRIERKYR